MCAYIFFVVISLSIGFTQVKGPTPLWQTGLLSKAGHELQPPIPVAAATPSSSGTTAVHQKRNKVRRTRNSPGKHTPLQQPTDLENVSSVQLQTQSHDGFQRTSSQVQIGRPPSASKLRGRLGHLISAIADAHKATSGTNKDCRDTVTAVAPSSPTSSSLTQAHRRAWSATAVDDFRPPEDPISHVNSAQYHHHGGTSLHVHVPVQDSLNSSYSDIEVHMCSKCDRIYHCRGELEKHECLCEV